MFLVAPALVVAAVAAAALLVRSGGAAALVRCWRVMLAATACVLSVLMLDDTLRAHVAVGRYFLATLRASTACLVGFCGLVGLLGPPESGGFSSDQTREWLQALGLAAGVATSGVGGGTLLLAAMTLHNPNNNSSNSGDGDATMMVMIDWLSLTLYGILLLLVAAGCLSRLLEVQVPLLELWVQGLRMLMRQMRVSDPCQCQADRDVTWLLVKGADWAAATARMLWRALRRSLGRVTALLQRGREHHHMRDAATASSNMKPSLHPAYTLTPANLLNTPLRPSCSWCDLLVGVKGLLQPLLRGFAAGLRVLGSGLRAACFAAASMFLREAVTARAVLPYGAAGAVAAVIAALMAGKTMRKSRFEALSCLGAVLERYAAAAYIHLDLGLSKPAARVLRNAMAAAVLTAQLLAATGRQALALLAVPLAAVLTASLTVAAWFWRRVGRVLYPWVAAAWRCGCAAATTIWSHPEWSLVLAAVVLAASYGAHAAQLPAAAGRLAAAWGAAAGDRCLSRFVFPLLHRLAGLTGRAAVLLGPGFMAVSAQAAAVANAVTGWGRRCGSGTDLILLFRSESFAVAFLGLNLLHALALKGWAVPVLEAQGPAGREAVLPVISFLARSSGKVALGPMYLTAAASLLTGSQSGLGGGMAAHMAALTVPVLWALYLAALWLEGVRRLSYDPRNSNNSEFGRVVQAVRYTGATHVISTSATQGRRTTAALATGMTTAPHSATTLAALVMVTAAARHAAPAGPVPAPTTAGGTADSDQKRHAYARLREEIRAQVPPGNIFNTDMCAVCFEALHSHNTGPDVGDASSSDPTSSTGRLQQQRQQQIRSASGGWRGVRQVPREGLGTTGASSGGVGGRFATGSAPGQNSWPGDEVATGREESAQGRLVLRCGHSFHEWCVLEWLLRSPRCPMCREPAVGASRHINMLF
ncbi:hypothetical protein VOLCADRAFT_89157 [Volvox carteri f. nagariensis]|uniref:RING-type domain-containing protein n=1 Tax=Volvox carteri f. nagariensis TaxID=3068 RepID=D8TQY3_VOLCA|nr:uncharacterized protein VOLCADRAFT_89157 [Volvox carteri f. nagariensis]EFJ50240.1 hypothetical protein VOLCADRAFT_89157 [Volvox carteri f. nagariensis]|eukprot:XP_002948860.1 hypothetical protein VOLCADRAFT_89157 [Volvox carteri f. nagariensis]